MRSSLRMKVALGFALMLSAALGAAGATLAGLPLQGETQQAAGQSEASPLVKPLDQYFIGDVFPRAATEASAETGRTWRLAATELSSDAQSRRQAIAEAILAKRDEVRDAKQRLRAARRERDLVQIGMLEGTVKNEELLLDILEDLEKLAQHQIALATAWSEAGAAMERFTLADTAFDPFRSRRLTRPEAGATDERLGPDGVQAFRSHAEAMDNLGSTFRRLGERARNLAKERMNLLKTLEKGGHLQAGR